MTKEPTLVRGLNDKHWQVTYLGNAPATVFVGSDFLLNGDILEPLPGQTLVVR